MKQQMRKWLLIAPLGAVGLAAGVLAALNPGLEAQTSPDNPDLEMRSRYYEDDVQTVRDAILETVPQLRSYGSHWRLASVQSDNKIAAEVPVLMFTDDLTVMLREAGNGTRVDVHSQTRFQGKSDLGENRRHVLQLLAALDEQFSVAN